MRLTVCEAEPIRQGQTTTQRRALPFSISLWAL